MPNTLLIKRRIKSVSNVAQITKAMELTAAAKMHKASSAVLGARPYAIRADVLAKSLDMRGAEPHPLTEIRPIKNQLIIMVTSDRGLAGGLNASLVRETVRFIQASSAATRIVIIGKKGVALCKRFNLNIAATFTNAPSQINSLYARPISLLARTDFLHKTYDAVLVAYNHFQSTLVQKPIIKPLLPLSIHPEISQQQDSQQQVTETLFEPSSTELLETVLPRLVDQLFLQMLLESTASEFASRMVAMRNATDNASDLLEDLALTFNSIRQSSITTGMAEISSSITALEE